MTSTLSSLASAWLNAKDIEAKAIAHRREIEDKMKSLIGVPDALDGTETVKPDGYIIKVTGRINRKINADKLQELASEAGLTEHLSSLFRWKPELNMKEWRNASPDITGKLSAAITTTAGRPSFSIECKE